MNIKKAVEHFIFKFKKVWKPTKRDAEALREIIDFVEKASDKTFENQQLFGKLYIYCYGQLIEHYRTTVFDPIPQKELHRILDTPIENLIQDFTNKLNESDRYEFFDKTGIKIEHPLLKSEERKAQEIKATLEMLKKTSKEEMLGAWRYEDVKENLTTQINLSITKFSN